MVNKSKQEAHQNESFCLLVDQLRAGAYQPRKSFDEATLFELAESIRSQGIIQPLVVRKQGEYFEIIAGERRWRAAKIAGLKEVPVVIRSIDDNVALAFSLIENIQRENLNPIEEAQAYIRFKNEFDMTHEEIAKTVGRSRASVTNTLRLLTLSEVVKRLLENHKLDMGHARALLTLSHSEQENIANKIVAEQLSVRDTEALAAKIKSPKHIDRKLSTRPSFTNDCNNWSNKLSDKLSLDVSVKLNQKGIGSVSILVSSLDEVEWLVEHLKTD